LHRVKRPNKHDAIGCCWRSLAIRSGVWSIVNGFEKRQLPRNTVSINTEIAALLIDIEAQLRQLGQWDRVPPTAEALSSKQPFSVDTLTLPQWLQFVFLPTLYRMMEDDRPLPQRCGIAPMAEEYFRGTGLRSRELEAALLRIDELLSAGS